MEFKRLLKMNMKGHPSYFLFGPRQVGKSTWLKKTFPGALYYDLLKSDLFFRLSRQPHILREEVLSRKKTKLVIIDEIQKLPPLLDEVHHLIEERKNLSFILTGSSARKLRRGA